MIDQEIQQVAETQMLEVLKELQASETTRTIRMEEILSDAAESSCH